MQAPTYWSPPSGTLGRIIEETRERVARLRARRADLERSAKSAGSVPSFLMAVRGGGDVSVIAEVKRRSPSKGTLNDAIDPATRSAAYELGGARAISVLTEERHFGGSPQDLEKIRGAVRIPLLKKDFHVESSQIFEARVLGASAVLLIARAVPPASLGELASVAREIGLEPLIEVRDEHELASAIDAGARVIGVNSRNLETLEIDPGVCESLLPLIPNECAAVFESGVRNREDVQRAARLGATAVLVGSALSTAPDPAAAVRGLAGVPRMARG